MSHSAKDLKNVAEYASGINESFLANNDRGIAQAAQVSFDELLYNDVGNQVTAISRIKSSFN